MDDMDDTTAGEGLGDTLGGDLLVDDPAVLDFLHRLQDAGRGPVPEIGDELAAVLAAAAVPGITARRRRGPGRRGIAGVAVLGFMAAGAGAAAADGLPRPVQRVVSDVVSRWTPFDVPHPDDSTAPRAVPTPSSIPRPAESEDDVDAPQQAPVAPVAPDPARPARQRGGEDGDDTPSGEDGSRTDDDAGEDGHDGADRPAPTSRPTSDGDGSSHSGDDESDGGSGGSEDSADDSTDGGEDHDDESDDRSSADRSSDHGGSDGSGSGTGD